MASPAHLILEAAGWAMMDGTVGNCHPQTSLQYRYGWGTEHGQEVIADGDVGTSGKCAYWQKGATKGRKAAPAGLTEKEGAASVECVE